MSLETLKSTDASPRESGNLMAVAVDKTKALLSQAKETVGKMFTLDTWKKWGNGFLDLIKSGGNWVMGPFVGYLDFLGSDKKEGRKAIATEAPPRAEKAAPVASATPAERQTRSELPEDAMLRRLEAEKGELVARYCRAIHDTTHKHLGKYYKSKTNYLTYHGKGMTLDNNCVGFTMSGFEGLPIRVYTKDFNNGKLATNYAWGGARAEDARDGWRDYVPDLAGRNPDRYRSFTKFMPGDIERTISPHLAVGEYAVAATDNHVFWIYKNREGKIMMIHSGADVEDQFQGTDSCVNEPYLSTYLAKRHPNGTHFAFVSVSNMMLVQKEHENIAALDYFSDRSAA